MHRFDFPDTLPHAPGIQPEFERHFSGWHLGMGLPEALAGLLHGLTQLGQKHPGCRDTAMGMALWGFQTHPLVASLSRGLIRQIDAGLKTPPKLGKLAKAMASVKPLDGDDAEAIRTWYALVRQDDHTLTMEFLALVLPSPQGLAWLGHCWQDMLFLNMPEIPNAALDMIQWDETTLPLKSRMKAEWGFQTQSHEEGLSLVKSLDSEVWGLWRTYAAAELLLRLGKKGRAKGALARLWKTIPWHVNLTLKLHDLLRPTPVADEADTANVAVLAYSWNKADLLKDTLGSLAESDIGKAKIFTLNNGSTDHTAEVLADAQTRFGADRFHIETLPINVGAPAARNWLLALPQVRAAKWAAFLDDDVVLPKDWLLKLLGAAQGKSDVGAVGCRITAAKPPFGLQSADYNRFPTPPATSKPDQLPNRVQLYDNCAGSTDSGLFTYTRPCLSVSGCCHMISLNAVEKAGIFDLRYTPSQFDDLDRDLRSALAGMPAVYAGDLAIRHVQHSSLAKSQNTKQIGHVMGNKFKLDTKYTDEELIRLGTDNRTRLWADLRKKHDFLVDRLGSGN